MNIGVPKEIVPGERRVALVPDAVARLCEAGLNVIVESGAGEAANIFDSMYREAGANVVDDSDSVWEMSDIVLKVQAPTMDTSIGKAEISKLKSGSAIIGLLQPLTNLDLIKALKEKNVTSISMDTVPRIARAQSMDALSSMSSLAGYKAAIIAANSLAKYLPMMITAAGTYPPAKGLVLGAGVAGLQAIATSRRLGAVLKAFDVRPVVKEQVESLGATFVGLPEQTQTEDSGGYAKELEEESKIKEREVLTDITRDSDFVITTALIPGRPAPILITEEMVNNMRPGSVIIDIAAEAGGNCELTQPGEEIVVNGVIINGPLNLPSTMPLHASQMYSRNISTLLSHLVNEAQLNLDFDDAITQGCCITHQGTVMYGPAQAILDNQNNGS